MIATAPERIRLDYSLDPLKQALEAYSPEQLLVLYRGRDKGAEEGSNLNWTIDPFYALFHAGIWGVDDYPDNYGTLSYTVAPLTKTISFDSRTSSYRILSLPWGSRQLVPGEIQRLLNWRIITSQQEALVEPELRQAIGRGGVIGVDWPQSETAKIEADRLRSQLLYRTLMSNDPLADQAWQQVLPNASLDLLRLIAAKYNQH